MSDSPRQIRGSLCFLGPTRTGTPGSARGSPLVPYAHAQTIPPIQQASYPSQPSRFQPFDMNPSEVSLKDMLGIGRDRIHESRNAASGRRLLLV